MDRVFVDCIILSVGVSAVLGVGAYVFGSQVLEFIPAIRKLFSVVWRFCPLPPLPISFAVLWTLFRELSGEWDIPVCYDPFDYRNRRYQDPVDLCFFPSAQIPSLFIYFLSGFLDRYHCYAGGVLLLCTEAVYEADTPGSPIWPGSKSSMAICL